MNSLGERVQRDKRKRLGKKPLGITFKDHIEDGNPADGTEKE